MDTRYKGRRAELEVELRAAEKKVTLARPTTEARYDYVLDDGLKLLRVQVKYADGKAPHTKGAVRVDLRRWTGWPDKMTRTYKRSEVDLLLVYVPQMGKVLAFKPEAFESKTSLNIRLTASVNNQKKSVLLASDFIW